MVVAMLVASVGVHLVLWPVGDQVLALRWESPPLPAAGGIMEVSLLGPEDEDEPPEPEPIPTPPSELRPVVRPDFVPDKRAPDQARFLSEFDSRVERETRAPNRRRAEAYDPSKVAPQSGAGANAPRGTAEQDTPPHALPLGLRQPGTSEDHPFDRELPDDDADRTHGRSGATAPPPGLRGTADAMRKTFGGGSGSYDHLPDAEDGAESLLNTDRFRFASFFNRMRDQIAQHWDPNGVMARVDPEGRIYTRRTRKTLLHFRLTPKGAIKKIDILRDSGVRELDKEAIRSVHMAAPFVNPPPEMIDPQTGFIEVDFLFILEEDGRTTRIRRYLR